MWSGGARLVKIPWSCIRWILTGAVGRQNEKRVLNFAILLPILHLLSPCKTCNEGKWKEVNSVLSIWGLGIWQTVDDAEFTWAILLFVEKRCYSWGTVDDVKAILLFAYTQWQYFLVKLYCNLFYISTVSPILSLHFRRFFERSNPKQKEDMCQEAKWTLLKGNRIHQNLVFRHPGKLTPG